MLLCIFGDLPYLAETVSTPGNLSDFSNKKSAFLRSRQSRQPAVEVTHRSTTAVWAVGWCKGEAWPGDKMVGAGVDPNNLNCLSNGNPERRWQSDCFKVTVELRF